MKTAEFLQTVFGDADGFLFLSGKNAPADSEITIHKAFKYPESLKTIETYASMREDEDLYFSPMLYKVPLRRQSSVQTTPVVYADTDRFPVDQFLVPPSINIETSPGRHASLWLLDSYDYEPEQVASVARAIALTHAKTEGGVQVGTDTGGWDLTQLIRMPNSINRKFEVPGKYDGYTEPYPVFVDEATSNLHIYSLQEIADAYDPDNLPALPARASVDMPDLDSLPPMKDVLRKITASSNLSALYSKKPSGGEDRSQVLYHFICECLRAGLTPEETFAAAWHAESNKYRIDGRPRDDLWTYDMRKALADPANRPKPILSEEVRDTYLNPTDEGVSTAIEFALLKEDELPTKTFVDEYVAWASSKTDAPSQYHVASAFTIMSCVFGDWGIAPPLYGDLNLGLSFVVMGETTQTRKSTARNLMKQFLRACQDDDHQYLLTSDATEEALIDALAERPFQTSLYDRDEAQKLLADVKGGKGYMKGFLETLNELYDGRARGRLRTTKQTKEAEVVFVQYFMGIRSQIQDTLELKDFESGWGPRNIYVRGESAPRSKETSLLQQQNPDSSFTGVDVVFEALVSKITNRRDKWERRLKYDREHKYKMFFEDDAWVRIAELEFDLEEYFKSHPRTDTLVACAQRLSTNALKVATLFAMAEGRDKAVLQDVINARYYVARWVEDLFIMVEGVSESNYARELKILENWIVEKATANNGKVLSGNALSFVLNNFEDKRYNDYKEMIKVLSERNVIYVAEDAKGKQTLVLVS